MTTLQTAVDRLEIEDLLSRYTWAIDSADWAALSDVFTPDAQADYRSLGGSDALLSGLDEIVAWLDKKLTWRGDAVPWHFVTNHIVHVEGDVATSRHYLHNRHLTVLGRYELVSQRTARGWRISSLAHKAIARQGPLPDGPVPPPATAHPS